MNTSCARVTPSCSADTVGRVNSGLDSSCDNNAFEISSQLPESRAAGALPSQGWFRFANLRLFLAYRLCHKKAKSSRLEPDVTNSDIFGQSDWMKTSEYFEEKPISLFWRAA